MEETIYTFREAFELGVELRDSLRQRYKTRSSIVWARRDDLLGSQGHVNISLMIREENLPEDISGLVKKLQAERFFAGVDQHKDKDLIALEYSIPYL